MSKIKELREQQAKIVHDARSALEEINDETPDERAQELNDQFDRAMEEHDKLEGQIQRLIKLDAAQRDLDAPDPRRPGGDGEGRGEGDGGDDEINYRDVYTKAFRFGVSACTPAEQRALQDARADIPEEVRAQAVGTEAAGGYIVPEEFSGEIDKAMAAWGPLWDADIVREISTSNGREIKWPTVDDTGNTGRIKAENASVDDDGSDDVVFGETELNAYIYDTGMIRVPLELLQDSFFNMESMLSELLGERLGRLANSILTTGTGSSQPNGLVTASSLGVTAAGAAAITSDELLNLLHSVDPAYRASPKVRWMFNDSTLNVIRKLKDGQGNYLWQMGDVRTSEPSRILGHAYSVNQAMANVATGQRSIVFGDFGRYIVRKVFGFQTMTLRERYAENFQIGVVGFKRFDGELLNTAAVKHLIQA